MKFIYFLLVGCFVLNLSVQAASNRSRVLTPGLSLELTPSSTTYSVGQLLIATVRGGTAGSTYTLRGFDGNPDTGTPLSAIEITRDGQDVNTNTVTWAENQIEATFIVYFLAGSEGTDRVLQVGNADASETSQSSALTIIPAPVLTLSPASSNYSETQSVTATMTGGLPGQKYILKLYNGPETGIDNDLSALMNPSNDQAPGNTITWNENTSSVKFYVQSAVGSKGTDRTLAVVNLDYSHVGFSSPFTIISCPIAVSISATPGLAVASGSSVTLTASGANSYTWSNGSGQPQSGSAITINSGTSAATYSVTGVTGLCSATARATVSPLSLTASSPTLTTPLVLSAANCPVQFTGLGWGKTFVLTGPGGYAYTTAFRDFVLGSPITAPGIRQAGNYTLTLYGFEGQTPVSYPIQVTGSCN